MMHGNTLTFVVVVVVLIVLTLKAINSFRKFSLQDNNSSQIAQHVAFLKLPMSYCFHLLYPVEARLDLKTGNRAFGSM